MAVPAISLPNLVDVGKLWTQLVAYSPVLAFFDNSEVRLEDDIPFYTGFPGLFGQMLALMLVSVAVVKSIYSGNEMGIEDIKISRKRKRDIWAKDFEQSDSKIYLKSDSLFELPLPGPSEVFWAWLQYVAYSPVLVFFQNSEVANVDNFPSIKGFPGLLGQLAALLFVSVAVMKSIYATNERALLGERRGKKSLHFKRNEEQESDFYFKVAQMLDKDSCSLYLFCYLQFKNQSEKLEPYEAFLIKPFGKNPRPLPITRRSDGRFPFSFASFIGSTAKTEDTCKSTFPKCKYSGQQMTEILKYTQTLLNFSLPNLEVLRSLGPWKYKDNEVHEDTEKHFFSTTDETSKSQKV